MFATITYNPPKTIKNARRMEDPASNCPNDGCQDEAAIRPNHTKPNMPAKNAIELQDNPAYIAIS